MAAAAAGCAHLVAAQAPSCQVWALLQHVGLHGLDLLDVLLTGHGLGGEAVLNLQCAVRSSSRILDNVNE
jgi:hypothetical protein